MRGRFASREMLLVRWGWTAASAFALLTMACFGYALCKTATNPPGIDFSSFWAAARLVLRGDPALAYDISAHRAVELSAVHLGGLMPFPYPPPFLLVATPFGLLPFPASFASWVLATGTFYVLATSRDAPLPFSLALPPAISNVLIGQNGFLLTGLFVFAGRAVEPRPVLSGVLFGLLCIKPQLALLVPVALVAGKHWRTLLCAAITCAALAGVATISLGIETSAAFLEILPQYGRWIGQNRWSWSELASVFAFARYFGAPVAAALTAQAVAAAAAIAVTWMAWQRRLGTRLPILAAATIMVTPYLFTYDALLMIVPFGWFVLHRQPAFAALIWFATLLPVLGYLALYGGPNPIPLAAAIAIWALYKEKTVADALPRQLAASPAPTTTP